MKLTVQLIFIEIEFESHDLYKMISRRSLFATSLLLLEHFQLFNSPHSSNAVMKGATIGKWILAYPSKEEKAVRDFAKILSNEAAKLDIKFMAPSKIIFALFLIVLNFSQFDLPNGAPLARRRLISLIKSLSLFLF